jgi:hypothetical protein
MRSKKKSETQIKSYKLIPCLAIKIELITNASVWSAEKLFLL